MYAEREEKRCLVCSSKHSGKGDHDHLAHIFCIGTVSPDYLGGGEITPLRFRPSFQFLLLVDHVFDPDLSGDHICMEGLGDEGGIKWNPGSLQRS